MTYGIGIGRNIGYSCVWDIGDVGMVYISLFEYIFDVYRNFYAVFHCG